MKDEILEKETEDALSSEFKSEVDSDTFNTDTYIGDVTNHIGSYSDYLVYYNTFLYFDDFDNFLY